MACPVRVLTEDQAMGNGTPVVAVAQEVLAALILQPEVLAC